MAGRPPTGPRGQRKLRPDLAVFDRASARRLQRGGSGQPHAFRGAKGAAGHGAPHHPASGLREHAPPTGRRHADRRRSRGGRRSRDDAHRFDDTRGHDVPLRSAERGRPGGSPRSLHAARRDARARASGSSHDHVCSFGQGRFRSPGRVPERSWRGGIHLGIRACLVTAFGPGLHARTRSPPSARLDLGGGFSSGRTGHGASTGERASARRAPDPAAHGHHAEE